MLHKDSTKIAWLFKSDYTNAKDTAGRDIIISTSKEQSIYVQGDGKLFSDEGLQTSLVLFRLSSLMNQSVWFSATRTSTHYGSESEIIPFPKIWVNQGNNFVGSTHFTAPVDGLYFVSLNIGAWQNEPTVTWLMKNGISLGTLAKYSTANPSNIELVSRANMYHLNKGDLIYAVIDKAHRVWDRADESYTALSGFLYDPIHGKKVAWSVAKTKSWYDDTFVLEPIPFEEILVNVAGGWDGSKHIFITPTTGLYYVTVTVGAQAGKPVDVSVVIDMKRNVRLTRYSTHHNNIDMLSRSAILHLAAGSIVRLKAESNTAIYSTQERHTTFSGFLLFPHEK